MMDRHFDEASGGDKGFEVEGSPGGFKPVFKQWNKMDCVDDVGYWGEWEKGILGEEVVVVMVVVVVVVMVVVMFLRV